MLKLGIKQQNKTDRVSHRVCRLEAGTEARIGICSRQGELTCAKALRCKKHVVGVGLPAHQCD